METKTDLRKTVPCETETTYRAGVEKTLAFVESLVASAVAAESEAVVKICCENDGQQFVDRQTAVVCWRSVALRGCFALADAVDLFYVAVPEAVP